MNAQPPTVLRLVSLKTRLLSIVYEGVIVVALLFLATALFIAVFGDSRAQPLHFVLQAYLLIVTGAYFVWSWTGGRRTLAMRTWRMRLVDRKGETPNPRRAAIRYVAALVGLFLGAISLFWALVDTERQFLHDRIAGTRLCLGPTEETRVSGS